MVTFRLRCEMLGTRPRRMASSAISRWLQWLMGRSLSDGFSHVIAITAQICSGCTSRGYQSFVVLATRKPSVSNRSLVWRLLQTAAQFRIDTVGTEIVGRE